MQEFDTELPEKMDEYVIIGLGRFGKSLALNLANMGNQVLAIDTDQNLVRSVQDSVTSAVVADGTKLEVLKSLGVQNFDCAVICIGRDLEASTLATLNCKELKVPYVITKAQNEQHKKILEGVGADLVVFPEVFMSRKLATALSNPTVNEAMAVNENFKIVEIVCPENWANKSIVDSNIRKKYNVSIIMIKRGEEVIYPDSSTILEEDDNLIIAGETAKIDNISNKLSENVDFRNAFTDAYNED